MARDVAVIDIGSNSIRLVLYRVEGRAIWTTYNEKVLAGLGRGLLQTGQLSPAGAKAAHAALRRFKAVLESVRPAMVFAVATAAVREAKDGPAFVAEARAETGLDVRVLSGEEEARYSALGVAAALPGACGTAGDLGGFSLELIGLENGEPGQGATLPLGPFALGAGGAFEPDAVRKAVKSKLNRVRNSLTAETFYAIGGAWRNLALLHMQLTDYPLHIVQGYELSGKEAIQTCRFVASQSRGSLERMPGISKKRAETLPYAAVVLELLVEALELKRVVISASGLREGLVYEALPQAVRSLNPVVEGFASMGGRQDQAEALGEALHAWVRPVFAALDPVFSPERDDVLMAAAAALADFGSRLHPDHRADLVFDQVLRAPVPGMSHSERAFMAVAAFARHTGANVIPGPNVVRRLLTQERFERARAIGAALRLGCDLSGRSPPLLALSGIRLEKEQLVLSADPAGADLLLGEQTARRAATLAQTLGRRLEIRTN